MELDRIIAAREAGHHAALLQLLRPELTTKSDILVGAPAGPASVFAWPWAHTGDAPSEPLDARAPPLL